MWRIIFLLVFTTPQICGATSYARPIRHDVFSPNRDYVLDVDPETEVHVVYATKDRTKPLWSFSMHVWQAPFLLSNDGAVVATLAWEHIRVQDLDDAQCIEFRNKEGVFKAYSFAELCPNPARTILTGGGPIGGFWRTWYTELDHYHDDTFRVRTTDFFEY